MWKRDRVGLYLKVKSGMYMEQFIARQPIFDRDMNIFGYELLFRSGFENCFTCLDGDRATAQVIADSALSFGFENLLGGGKGFINFTRNSLLSDFALVLPKRQAVVEILENVEPDSEVLDACSRLKKKGYILALDDFVYDAKYNKLLKMADIVKVDFFVSNEEEREKMAATLIPLGVKMLAEKVESMEEYRQAVEMGYHYFQGYFFSKPVILSKKDIPGSKINQLRLLQMINEDEMDFQALSDLVQNEMSICYKLIKVVNCAAFGLRSRITSIKQALSMLGEKGIRTWASILSMLNLAEDKPKELILSSLVRAKFCESLSSWVKKWQNDGESLFLVGLFSRLDAIVGRPLKDLLSELPLKDNIKAAILGRVEWGLALALIEAFEKCAWSEITRLASQLEIDEAILRDFYFEAVKWSYQLESSA